MDTTRNQRRTLEGRVTGDRCSKTITVEVQRTFKHPKYKKYVRKVARYHAHDEKSEAKKGDRVEIRACRPLSATKRWMLVRVIDRAVAVDALDAVSGLAGATGSPVASAPAEAGGAS
jgi:small subunit ribosomal protein S17